MVYEMDRVMGSRINSGSTKVSQIANIFQNNLIQSDHHGLDGKSKLSTSTSSLMNNRKDIIDSSATDPVPIKTEGHVNRFNNARALFEKLGTGDEKLLSTSTPAPITSRFPVSKFKSSDSLNAFPSSTTTTTATATTGAERKPTPFVLNRNNTGSNGHSNNLIAQEISPLTPTPSSNSSGDASDRTPIIEAHTQQPSGVTGPRRVLFGSSVSVKEAAKQYGGDMKPSEKPPLFTKPPTLGNKVNGRELIEKQKNWISHFSSPPPKKPGSPEKQSKGFAVQPKQLEIDANSSPKTSPLSSPSKSDSPSGGESWTNHHQLDPPTANFILTPHAIAAAATPGTEEPDESLSSTSDYNGSTTTTTSQNTIVEVPIVQSPHTSFPAGRNGEPGLVRGGSSASILDDESFVDDTLSLVSVSTPSGALDVAAEEYKGFEEIEVVKEVAVRTELMEMSSVAGRGRESSIEQDRELSSVEPEEHYPHRQVDILVNGNQKSGTTSSAVDPEPTQRSTSLTNGHGTAEFPTGVQIVSERFKTRDDEDNLDVKGTSFDSGKPGTEESTNDLVDGGGLEEEEDIQQRELPEVPLEESESLLGESGLLDEGVSGMLFTTTITDTSGSSADLTDLAEGSPATYPAESGKEVHYEDGFHYYEDGHYWVEAPGIPGSDEDEDYFDQNIVKKQPTRVRFSMEPMKVYTTHSVNDYDRRNEDVDPAAAAAEYELEKRVEKMEVFPVDLVKGAEGLGLSIIGMGVGADAGLEKLGIFVKTITDSGAAAKDGRIMVNDQIIEVDGKSLVGVTQAYAASVLRNTAGLVKFMIGREKDPENSEVAQLIRQSLQADKERDERRKHQSQSLENQFNYSPRGPPPPPPPFEESLRHLAESSSRGGIEGNLNEKLQVAHSKALAAEKEVELLKKRLSELEFNVAEKESYEVKIKDMNEKVAEFEEVMKNAQMEVSTYQSMLQESQGQYSELEKKYQRVKQIVKTLQHRERDLTHRQEFQMQRIHQRDTEYHDLLKSLKERVIQLEHELVETQRHAGLNVAHGLITHFPTTLPTPLTLSLPPPLPPIDLQLSDEDFMSDMSDLEDRHGPSDKKNSCTPSIKEEFDSAFPQHNLLDISVVKARAGLIARGGLAGRQAPSSSGVKRPNSQASNHSLDFEGTISPEMLRDDSKSHLSTFSFSPPVSPAKSNTSAVSESQVFLSSASSPSSFNSSFISATSPISTSQLSKTSVASITSCTVAKEKEMTNSSSNSTTESTPFNYFSSTTNNNSSFKKTTTNSATTEILTQQKRLLMTTEVGHIPPPAKYAGHSDAMPGIGLPVHIVNRSYSPDTPVAVQHHVPPPVSQQHQYTIPAHSHYNHPPATLSSPHFHTTSTPLPPGVRPPPSSSHVHHVASPLTEQLRQVLADRERQGGHVTPTTTHHQNHSPPPMSHSQQLVPPPRRVIPEHWQGRKSDTESSGNTSISSNMSSPRIDTKPSPMPEKWMNLSPVEWSNEQVCQYLLFMNMEHLIPPFMDHGITGIQLLQIESKDLKAFGVNGEDKLKIKKKVKELKGQVEKEKKQLDKQRKEQEKLQKKTEKQKSIKK